MSRKQIKAAVSAAVLGVLSPLTMLVPASAATKVWNGGTDDSFNTGANWDGAVAPINGDTAEFPSTALFAIESQVDMTPDNDISSLSLAKLVFSGDVTKSSSNYVITGYALTLTSGIDAIMTGNGGEHQIKSDVTLGAAATFKATGSNALSVGDTSTTLALGSNTLTLQNDGTGTITLLGKITGTGSIVKSGTGKVDIKTTAGTGGYTGGLTIGAGETAVNENLGLPITVSGGTLKGTGTVGTVTMSSGAVAPGNSPGVINTGNLTYTGGAYNVELGGTTAGTFDQTNVTGTVTLGTATDLGISLVNSFAPKVNDSFIIINNDATDAVSGNFKGLKDGENVTLGSYTYQINYDGGTGNDVVLLVLGTPSAPYTGVGSLITSPTATFIAAVAVLLAIGGIRVAELKKAKARS